VKSSHQWRGQVLRGLVVVLAIDHVIDHPFIIVLVAVAFYLCHRVGRLYGV